MVYSRATTSAMAERWVLPVGFLVDDILEGSVVSRVPQVCNNFEDGELIECCERNRGSGLRTWATTGFSCCGERGRRSVVDAEYNEEALARISLWIFEKVRACAGIHSPKFPHWVSRPLFSDPTLCAPSRVADGCPPADELLSLWPIRTVGSDWSWNLFRCAPAHQTSSRRAGESGSKIGKCCCQPLPSLSEQPPSPPTSSPRPTLPVTALRIVR